MSSPSPVAETRADGRIARQLLVLLLLLALCLLLTLWGAWLAQPRLSQARAGPPDTRPTSLPVRDFAAFQRRLTASCMPCHQRQLLPKLIERTKQARFGQIGSDTRLRILAELQELEAMLESDTPLSFDDQASLRRLFAARPGEFYVMLERGLMPPPWAPELMQQIGWPYQPLTPEARGDLLRFAKPYSMPYLR